MHNRHVEKDLHFKENILKLFNYIKKYLPLIIPALILAFICSVISIIGPDKLKDMTDTITEGIITGIDLQKIKSIGTFLIVIYVAGAVFGYIEGFIMSTVTNRCAKNLRTEIGEKINRLPLKYFDKTSFGDVLSRVTNDVDTIAMTLNQTVTTLVTNSTLFL